MRIDKFHGPCPPYQVVHPAHHARPLSVHLRAVALVGVHQPEAEVVLGGEHLEQLELDRIVEGDVVARCLVEGAVGNDLRNTKVNIRNCSRGNDITNVVDAHRESGAAEVATPSPLAIELVKVVGCLRQQHLLDLATPVDDRSEMSHTAGGRW